MDNPRYFLKYDFDKIQSNSKVVIYGYGEIGRAIYEELKSRGNGDIVAFADKSAQNLFSYIGVKIISPDDIPDLGEIDYFFVGSFGSQKPIINTLKLLGIEEHKILAPKQMSYLDKYTILEEYFSYN